MNNQKTNEQKLYDLCSDFLEQTEMATDIDMANPRGGKLSMAFHGIVLETQMQIARLSGSHDAEHRLKARLADKVAGFLLNGGNAHHVADALPESVDQDIIELAQSRGLDNLVASLH